MTFEGIETLDDCRGIAAPEVTTYGSSCKFKGGKVKHCSRALDELQCPSEGFEFKMPEECAEVYFGCAFESPIGYASGDE